MGIRTRANFIVVDGWRHRFSPLQDDRRDGKEGEWVTPEITDDGYAIFSDAPFQMVQHYVSVQPERFKLWRCAPLQAQKQEPDLTTSWQTYYPWSYRKISHEVPDPKDPEKRTVEWEDEWFEVKDPHDYEKPPEHWPKDGEPAPATALPPAGPAPEPPPPPPPLPETKTKQQVLNEAEAAAVAVVGQEEVDRLKKEYRAKIGKLSGAFTKNQHFEMLAILRSAAKPKE
jgi:hypothetical protein